MEIVERKKYIVSLQSKQISPYEHTDNNDFTIYGTESEIKRLRAIFNRMDAAELDTYWRAHVPFMPYHNDPSNDRYDKGITDAFQLIYELGDKRTKEFIDESRILSDRPIDTDVSF